mmetsp:Transcript_6742/g.27509  ORF Transcript_6742/g.27509 Transcript_6742/m.27509 type:complete len:288 (-) Transcript_6742:615-1478(-)
MRAARALARRERHACHLAEEVDLLAAAERPRAARVDHMHEVRGFGHRQEIAVGGEAQAARSADAPAEYGQRARHVPPVPDAAGGVLVARGEDPAVRVPRGGKAVVEVPPQRGDRLVGARVEQQCLRVVAHHAREAAVGRYGGVVDRPVEVALRDEPEGLNVELPKRAVVVACEDARRRRARRRVDLKRVGDCVLVAAHARAVRHAAAAHRPAHNLAPEAARRQDALFHAQRAHLHAPHAVAVARQVEGDARPSREAIVVTHGATVQGVHIVRPRRPHQIAQLEVHDG